MFHHRICRVPGKVTSRHMLEEIELKYLFYMDVSYFLIPFFAIFLLITKSLEMVIYFLFSLLQYVLNPICLRSLSILAFLKFILWLCILAWSLICSSSPPIPEKCMSLSGTHPFLLYVNNEENNLFNFYRHFLITAVEKLTEL